MGSLDVGSQGVERGRGHKPVGPVALVEQPPQEDGPVVEHDAGRALGVWLDRDRAKGAVTRDLILSIAEREIIEAGVVRFPELGVLDAQPDRCLVLFGDGSHRRPAALKREDQASARVADLGRDRDGAIVRVGTHLQLSDVVFGDVLDPDALPDAGLSRIPHVGPHESLLAAKLRARVARVEDADGQGVLSVLDGGRYVYVKGQVATPVLGESLAVQIDRTGPVHALEVQDVPAPRQGSACIEAESVPKELIWLELAADVRELGLWREGHEDLAIPGDGHRGVAPGATGFLGRAERDEGVVPPAVERLPRCAGKLRARVLWPGDGAVARSGGKETLSPDRGQGEEGSAYALLGLALERTSEIEVHGLS